MVATVRFLVPDGGAAYGLSVSRRNACQVLSAIGLQTSELFGYDIAVVIGISERFALGLICLRGG